jgi:hypothetical protein
MRATNERHARLFGDTDLPRRIGAVENVGLQIPRVSPNGRQMLYLQTDQDYLSPLTLLGSPDPQHTPPEGSLSVWLRPVEGAALGRRFSPQRWAHSPVWSDTGDAVAYVVNEHRARGLKYGAPDTSGAAWHAELPSALRRQ